PRVPRGFVKEKAKLGGDHRLIPAAFEGPAQDALAVARAVYVRRVKEVDAEVKGSVDRPDRLGIVHIAPAVGKAVEEKRAADGPASKSHRAHFDAAVPQPPLHHAHFSL